MKEEVARLEVEAGLGQSRVWVKRVLAMRGKRKNSMLFFWRKKSSECDTGPFFIIKKNQEDERQALNED